MLNKLSFILTRLTFQKFTQTVQFTSHKSPTQFNMDDLKKAMGGKMAEYQKSFQTLLADNQEAMHTLLEEARKRAEQIKTKTGKEAEEMKTQFKNMNDSLMTKVKQMKDDSKKKLDSKYAEITSSPQASPDKVTELKGQLTAMVKKFGDKSSTAYKDALKKIDDFKGQSKPDIDKFYKDVTKHIDDAHNEAVKKLNALKTQ